MKNLHRAILLVGRIVLLVSLSAFAAETPYEQACASLASRKGNDSARLQELFQLDWEHSMQESPEFATEVGYPGQNARWSDQSLEAIGRRQRELNSPLKVLDSIERGKLSPADQLNYDLFRKNITDAIEGTRFKGEYMPITQLNGVQQGLAETLEISPRATAKDYEDILARLTGVPKVIEQNIVLLKKGLETGITPPRITLRDVPQQIESQMTPEPERNEML